MVKATQALGVYLSSIIAGKIEISPLLDAFKQFQSALKVAQSDLEKAGTIQYFEFTFELAWKTMRRILSTRGKDINSPRLVFRESALDKLISDPEIWFKFLEHRNQTVHTYRRNIASDIFASLHLFESEMLQFIQTIQSIKE